MVICLCCYGSIMNGVDLFVEILVIFGSFRFVRLQSNVLDGLLEDFEIGVFVGIVVVVVMNDICVFFGIF